MSVVARIGAPLYLTACAALGLVEMIFRKPLPELHPFSPSLPVATYAAGASLAFLALAGIAKVRGARLALSVYWLLAAIVTVAAALQPPADPVNWVPVSKAALFAIAAAAAAGSIGARALRLSLGLVLIFYGLIHLILHDVIAQLIPGWFPQAAAWPYFTGALMLVAGTALVIERAAEQMAIVVAALFASWIVVIHSGRLIGHPASSFEWTFALSALALVGIALMAVSPGPSGAPPD